MEQQVHNSVDISTINDGMTMLQLLKHIARAWSSVLWHQIKPMFEKVVLLYFGGFADRSMQKVKGEKLALFSMVVIHQFEVVPWRWTCERILNWGCQIRRSPLRADATLNSHPSLLADLYQFRSLRNNPSWAKTRNVLKTVTSEKIRDVSDQH